MWRRNYEQKTTNLSKGGFRRSNDVQVVGHDLCDVRNTLDAEALEDERDCLHDHRVLRHQGRVFDDAHQLRDGDRRVEVLQCVLTHVHQHLARTHVCCKRSVTSQQLPTRHQCFELMIMHHFRLRFLFWILLKHFRCLDSRHSSLHSSCECTDPTLPEALKTNNICS